MAELRTLVREEMERAGSPSYSFDDLGRRRDRKRRNQRIAAGVVGIAVFVAAVWVVTSVGSMDRSEKSVAPAGEVTGSAETAPPPPLAPGALDVVKQGTCSDGARWRLEVTDTGDRLRVRFEVYQSPVGHEWLIHFRYKSHNIFTVFGHVFFRGTRVASDSGDLVVHQRVSDPTIEQRSNGGYWAEPGVWVAKAVDTQTGQRCRVYMGP